MSPKHFSKKVVMEAAHCCWRWPNIYGIAGDRFTCLIAMDCNSHKQFYTPSANSFNFNKTDFMLNLEWSYRRGIIYNQIIHGHENEDGFPRVWFLTTDSPLPLARNVKFITSILMYVCSFATMYIVRSAIQIKPNWIELLHRTKVSIWHKLSE